MTVASVGDTPSPPAPHHRRGPLFVIVAERGHRAIKPATGNRSHARSLRLFLALVFFAGYVFHATTAGAGGNPEKGREIAEKHCSRCHVVGRHNPLGGIGSTASFQMIAKMPDYLERFQTFYARRPHPAFLRVPGVPRWSKLPAYATEIIVTLDQVDDIVAFVKTLEKLPIRRKKR